MVDGRYFRLYKVKSDSFYSDLSSKEAIIVGSLCTLLRRLKITDHTKDEYAIGVWRARGDDSSATLAIARRVGDDI